MTTNTQAELNRLVDLRRRALDSGLDDNARDRELIRRLDRKIADLYGRREQERQAAGLPVSEL